MDSMVTLAFVISPALAIALGGFAYLQHQWFLARERRRSGERDRH
jgi:hypothetical protein